MQSGPEYPAPEVAGKVHAVSLEGECESAIIRVAGGERDQVWHLIGEDGKVAPELRLAFDSHYCLLAKTGQLPRWTPFDPEGGADTWHYAKSCPKALAERAGEQGESRWQHDTTGGTSSEWSCGPAESASA